MTSSPSSVAFELEKRKRGNKWVRCGGVRSLGSRVSQHLAMRCRVPSSAPSLPSLLLLAPSSPAGRPAGCCCCPFADSNQHRFISISLTGPLPTQGTCRAGSIRRRQTRGGTTRFRGAEDVVVTVVTQGKGQALGAGDGGADIAKQKSDGCTPLAPVPNNTHPCTMLSHSPKPLPATATAVPPISSAHESCLIKRSL